MKKHFVCLANSFKLNGRCLAGIEITINDSGYSIVRRKDGAPLWIRPVSRSKTNELPVKETRNINLLDVLEIEVDTKCPNGAHSENCFYSSLRKTRQNIHQLNDLCDMTQSNIFFNKWKAIKTEEFQQKDYSLMFVKVSSCSFYNDEKNKLRTKFSYNDIEYDLPVTDPAFVNYMKTKGLDHVNAIDSFYFTLSLGEEFNGWHHKLVAGVVGCPGER